MKTIALLLVLFFALPVWGATINVYVDTGATGAANGTSWEDAYLKFYDAELASRQNLVTGGNSIIFNCRASTGVEDTNAVAFGTGWTVDASNTITAVGTDFPATGIFDPNKYVLHITDATYGIQATVGTVYIRNMQIALTVTANNTAYCIRASTIASAKTIVIDSCILKAVSMAGTGGGRGIAISDSDWVVKIQNCTAYGFVSGTDADFIGMSLNCGTADVFNCTVFGNRTGFVQSAGTVTIKNCISCNNNDDFSGTLAISNCLSDDQDGDANQVPVAAGWGSEMVDPNNGNFTLVVGGNAIDNGTADLFDEDDDIIGTVRPQGVAWDIGAYEYEEPPVGGTGAALVKKQIIFLGKNGGKQK